jgi:uncharacterized protein YbaA (DUF1428 family)
MSYVDGFVIVLPKKNKKAYEKMAKGGARSWMKHGALQYFEAIGDDLSPPFGKSFKKLLKLKPSETAVFSFIVFKSRKHRDQVNAKVMAEMGSDPGEMPFDDKRMSYGGFKVLVQR